MTAQELRQKYLDFFVQKGHKIISSASLIPEEKVELVGTQRVLFTTAGMHPLIPYLLGESHPEGKRLVNVQKCLRTDDIDEVGDKVHHTFFEMLGNWSLGDYWKRETIEWSFEFLTSKAWLGIPKEKLAISVFAGDQDAPFDQESYDVWRKLEIPESRIAKLPKKNNWWGPVGETGPCGPDTEMFVWGGKGQAPEKFDPEDPGWAFEVWNDVFMEYNKTAEGNFEPLAQKNVDTGMGLERMLAVLNGTDDDYQTELFIPIIRIIEQTSGKDYADYCREMRIIADHLKAAIFIASNGVPPSNKGHGYVIRRLLRRAIWYGRNRLFIDKPFTRELVDIVGKIYGHLYPEILQNKQKIEITLEEEEESFLKTIDRGTRELPRLAKEFSHPRAITTESEVTGIVEELTKEASGELAFRIYETYGLPSDLVRDVLENQGWKLTANFEEEFQSAKQRHTEKSRASSMRMFKGGLADQSEQTVKYHTATHLLHAALRQILGVHVEQKGSNITFERLRFDFSHPQKLTEEEIRKVEDVVNEKIKDNLPVTMEEVDYEEAIKSGALAFFKERYGGKVKVYSIGSGPPFSREVCGGPHVDFTGRLGKFTIKKEEAAGRGLRRIYAVLE